ncbi:SMI1/KNR4 family protein [Actinacidiphila sp. bgisy144]|uniref:SMI1/KNR4 family protein n=1 Tax=Actinacidiphila sp. bgisy144 TaxID=3413791 RepID=UPI003EBA7636
MDAERVSAGELDALRAAFGVDCGNGSGSGADGDGAGGNGDAGGGSSALGWAGVRRFEAEHGVLLPEPYRTFVAEVADGSALGPPEYGLAPLGADAGQNGGRKRELARPFPLTEGWVWEDDPRPAAQIEPLLDRVFGDGSVVLGTDGCGMYWHLVLSGPHRGQVWLITGEGAVPFGAEFGHTGGAAGFAGWVRHWAADRPWFDED